jgi:hypothetical protein
MKITARTVAGLKLPGGKDDASTSMTTCPASAFGFALAAGRSVAHGSRNTAASAAPAACCSVRPKS